jgi:prepilin-type N-terminal cleavage/methylation domain-containing protein
MSRNVISKNTSVILEPAQECRGFTLVELLTVIAIIAILSAIVVFAISSIKGSQDLTRSAYVISGALEQARTYALANDTYSWVGFFEEDGSQGSPNAGGVGRVVISVVASQDGTRYNDNAISTSLPANFGGGFSSNTVLLTQISPLIKLSNIHMVAANSGTSTGNNPVRPATLAAYQVGDSPGMSPNNATGSFALHVGCTSGNPTYFTYPLSVVGVTQTTQYTFHKIIEFNPQGEASKIVENIFSGPGPQNEIEIAFQPAHGNVIAPAYTGANQTTAAAAIQVEGLSGQVRVYRQ